MENIKVKVKEERLPSRCETCHQSDCFDPINNHCSRCHDVVAMETSGTWKCAKCNLVNNRTYQTCRRCSSPLSDQRASHQTVFQQRTFQQPVFEQQAFEPPTPEAKQRVRFMEGVAYLNHQNYTPAINAFEDAIRANYKVAQCYYLLGNAHLGLRQLDEAEAAYKRALELDSKHEFARAALVNMGRATKLELRLDLGLGRKVLLYVMAVCCLYFFYDSWYYFLNYLSLPQFPGTETQVAIATFELKKQILFISIFFIVRMVCFAGIHQMQRWGVKALVALTIVEAMLSLMLDSSLMSVGSSIVMLFLIAATVMPDWKSFK